MSGVGEKLEVVGVAGVDVDSVAVGNEAADHGAAIGFSAADGRGITMSEPGDTHSDSLPRRGTDGGERVALGRQVAGSRTVVRGRHA